MTAYQPEQWRDFFVAVGSGSAALTGLLVVAVSMHLQTITSDRVVAHRAHGILIGLASIFIRCSLALMGGQTGRAVACELLVVTVSAAVLTARSYLPVAKTHRAHRSSRFRTAAGLTCNGIEIAGYVVLFFGISWGLNVAASAMMAFLCVITSGSWLLMLGVRQDEGRPS